MEKPFKKTLFFRSMVANLMKMFLPYLKTDLEPVRCLQKEPVNIYRLWEGVR